MRKNRFPQRLVIGILLSLFFIIALYLRIALPYDKVFVGEWIKLTSIDANYFMRQVDNLVRNFPNTISFDPYLLYPGGQPIGNQSLFVYLVSGIAWLISFGSPTQYTVDIVGAYLPAILGACSIIPVYFIGKTLFNRWAGLLASGLLAIAPGEFMGRSILGFADRDALEVLLTLLTMLFLILAIKNARQTQCDFNLRHLNWPIIKPLVYSLLAGICLGLYLLTWRGAFLFVGIILVFLVLQSIIDHFKRTNINYLGLIGTMVFLTALIIYIPSHPRQVYLISLIIALLASPILAVISNLMSTKSMKVGYYPLIIFGIGVISLAILQLLNPSILKSIISQLNILVLTETEATIIEMKPLLFPYGKFSLSVVWYNFTTGFFLSLISICILFYLVIKQGDANKTLILVWSLIILATTLALRRIALFFTINVAILNGYLAWLILNFAGLEETPDVAAEEPKEAIAEIDNKKRVNRLVSSQSQNWLNIGLAVVIIFFLFFFPNFTPAHNTAKYPAFSPSDGWCESLSWIKDNTPDPFGDPEVYYSSYTTPFRYPETAYGVTAWWDYGYLITRMGHRIPNCNPGVSGQTRQRVASLFIAQDEASATPIISQLKSRYVIIDFSTAVMATSYNVLEKSYVSTGKLPSIITYINSSTDNFYELYYEQKDGSLEVKPIFYPEYYRSLAVRLYNFDGEKVIPQDTKVFIYEEQTGNEVVTYRQVTNVKSFPSYEEAEAYVANQKSANYRIGSTDPFISPVPLEKLEHYKLVHSSKNYELKPSIGTVPQVKIFEFIE